MAHQNKIIGWDGSAGPTWHWTDSVGRLGREPIFRIDLQHLPESTDESVDSTEVREFAPMVSFGLPHKKHVRSFWGVCIFPSTMYQATMGHLRSHWPAEKKREQASRNLCIEGRNVYIPVYVHARWFIYSPPSGWSGLPNVFFKLCIWFWHVLGEWGGFVQRTLPGPRSCAKDLMSSSDRKHS